MGIAHSCTCCVLRPPPYYSCKNARGSRRHNEERGLRGRRGGPGPGERRRRDVEEAVRGRKEGKKEGKEEENDGGEDDDAAAAAAAAAATIKSFLTKRDLRSGQDCNTCRAAPAPSATLRLAECCERFASESPSVVMRAMANSFVYGNVAAATGHSRSTKRPLYRDKRAILL